MLLALLNALLLLEGGHKSSKPKAGPTRRRRALPRVEALEDRRVPAALVVTDLGDNGGVDPGVGMGTGTLRQAIVDADAAGGASTITFQRGVAGTINLQADLKGLDKNITINDAGSNIIVTCAAGAPVGIIFWVSGGTICEIDGLTVENTCAVGGRGITSLGALTLNSCTISNCTAGGILNDGTLNMYSCAVEWNTATNGGGIDNAATLSCYDCTISFNIAAKGGGIFNDVGSQVTLTNCGVSTNYASWGGGIYNNNGTLTVVGPRNGRPAMSLDLAYNTAVEAGGGLYQEGSNAQATFSGASIVSNVVSRAGGMGGGVCLAGGFAAFEFWCFIDSNSATNGTAIAFKSPGAAYTADPTCTVNGTIYYYS